MLLTTSFKTILNMTTLLSMTVPVILSGLLLLDVGKIRLSLRFRLMVDLPVNLGLAGAFQTGLRYAYEHGYNKAVQFDADGQHLPEYIQSLEEKINDGFDLVIGSRFVTEKRPNSLRMLGNILISSAIKLTTGKTIKDPTSGMRMFSEDLIKEFALNINYGPEPDTVSYLIRNGVKVAEAQVRMEDRQAGESYLTLSRSIKYMTHMFVSILLIQNFRKRG